MLRLGSDSDEEVAMGTKHVGREKVREGQRWRGQETGRQNYSIEALDIDNKRNQRVTYTHDRLALIRPRAEPCARPVHQLLTRIPQHCRDKPLCVSIGNMEHEKITEICEFVCFLPFFP
jgi:hypothetical protein